MAETTKHSADLLNGGDSILTDHNQALMKTSFVSGGSFGSSRRFDVQDRQDREAKQRPGPGHYNAAKEGDTLDHFDSQWTNKSYSARFGKGQSTYLIESGAKTVGFVPAAGQM